MINFFKNAKNDLPESRKYWADYLFHFTEMKNAVSILINKKILSRDKAMEKGIMYSENASQDVISHTPQEILRYVRFYFRPLTPTQYNNEGLKPGNPTEAHCPNPVFFLFDLQLINQYKKTCKFSEKTLASSLSLPYITNDPNKLNDYNYKKIYHTGSFDKEYDSDIIQYRQAEFIVKDEVDLTNLRWIVLRSQAEKATFLYWLHKYNVLEFDDKIIYYHEKNFEYMFNKMRLYVDNVLLEENFINVSITNKEPGYSIRYVIKYDEQYVEEIELDSNSTYYIPKGKYKYKYKFLIKIDGKKRYCDEYCKTDNDIF